MTRAFWTAAVSDPTPRKLGDGRAPAVSPKGDLVAYLAQGQIWAAHLDGSGKAEALIVEKGHMLSLAWSPDGARLAFVSQRNDHSLVGVYDVAQKSVVWMAPSVDRDAHPEWSPDGTRLAFVRVPVGHEDFFLQSRTGRPWSIWIADAATGQGHELWHAGEQAGSIFQPLQSEQQLAWGAGDRIVFPWERTGWLQLYAISARGGAPVALTSGECEIFAAAMTADRSAMLYAGNAGDIDRQHVWRVALSGGAPAELTPGQGIETYPAGISDGKAAAILRSDARRPMHVAIVTSNGQITDLASDAIPADFPAPKLVVPQQVVFSSADGLMIHGQLFVPNGPAARHPAIVFFHGGPIRQMLLGWHRMDAYSYMYAMNQYLASRGYVVLSVNYRGGIGYGLNFRRPPDFGPAGSSEANDIQGAGLYLRTRADVDPGKLGVWGASYGGLMTALALARFSDLYAAGVDYAGVHDWRAMLFPPPTDTTVAPARMAWQSSAMASIKDWRSPVLVIQADDDRNVPYAQAPELIEGLRAHGIDFEQMIIPNEVHDLLLYRSWVRVLNAAAEYFDRHLGTSERAAAR